MLCIRSAERFRQEAETRAKLLEKENFELKEELAKLRNDSQNETTVSSTTPTVLKKPWPFPLQILEYNGTSYNSANANKGSGSFDGMRGSVENILEKITNAATGMHNGQAYNDDEMVIRTQKLNKLRKTAGGSLRNALLRWCQQQIIMLGPSHGNLEINNFSSSWKDGKAILALLRSLNPPSDLDYGDDNANGCPLTRFEAAIALAKQMGVRVELVG